MVTTDPTMVIFNMNPSSGALPLGKDVISSWKNGPIKEKSFSQRGRPKKTIETGNLLYPRDGKPKALDQSPVPPLYEFVTWTDASGNTNAAARKLVRSYTMRHSKLRQNQSNHPCNVQHHSGSLVGLSRNSQNHSGTLKDEFREFLALMPHEVSTLDPFDCLPVRMQPYMLDLFTKYTTCIYERMYPIETYSAYNPMKDYLLPLAFKDLALFHAILFSSVCLKTPSPRYKEVPRALMHLNECIHLVNKTLRSPSPMVDDSTIVVVATIAYYEKLIGNHMNWAVHMRGLRQMVQSRGGLKTFRSNRVLCDLILRTDLCGSIDAGSMPYFEDIRVAAAAPMIQFAYSSEGFHKINGFACFSNDFNQILNRIEVSTNALNFIHCGGTPSHPFNLREEITSIQYALLRIESLQYDFHESKVLRICHYGLLLYLVSLSLLNGVPNWASICDILAGHLRDALQDNLDINEISPEFRLWLGLLIFTMARDETNKLWARREFATTRDSSLLDRQEDAKTALATFFWVDKIHGPSLDELWNEKLGNGPLNRVSRHLGNGESIGGGP